MKLGPRDFRCIICNEIRERGVFIRIGRGAFKGYIVKVCKRAECAVSAKAGEPWVEDPLLEVQERRRGKMP